FVPIAAEDLERLRTPVLQDQHVLNERWRDAGRCRCDQQVLPSARPTRQYTIEVAVIRTREKSDPIAACGETRQPQCHHDSFRAPRAEGDPLHPREFADERGGFPCQPRTGTKFDPSTQLGLDRLAYEWWIVTEQIDPEAHRDVHVFIAVDIPQPR